MAIFALNIMPYISASIIIQLMTTVSPTLEALKKEGESRPQDHQPVYPLSAPCCWRRSRPMASPSGSKAARHVVSDPGLFFRISTVITLTGGTMFLMWLGEQITARGVGNGISLIIFAGIVADLPPAHRQARSNSAAPGALSTGIILVIIVMAVVRHRLHRVLGARPAPAADPVSEAPGRQPHVRGRHLASAAEAQHLGRHPADLRLVAAAAADHGCDFQRRARAGMAFGGHHPLGHGQPLFLILYAALIVFFAFFYTAIVFNPPSMNFGSTSKISCRTFSASAIIGVCTKVITELCLSFEITVVKLDRISQLVKRFVEEAKVLVQPRQPQCTAAEFWSDWAAKRNCVKASLNFLFWRYSSPFAE